MPASFLLVLAMMGLRGAGDSVTPLKFMALSVVLDAALNPVLILGLGGLPRMGIAGSATATVIANYASLAALLAYVYARDLPLRLRGAELAYLRPQGALLRTILGKGLPMGLQMTVVSGAALAMMGLVNRHGVDGTIRAKGAVIAPLVILAISMFPVRLGLARGLEPWLGVDALWWSFPIASAASMTMTLLYWRFGGWRRARMPVPAAVDPHECEPVALMPAEHPALGDTHVRP